MRMIHAEDGTVYVAAVDVARAIDRHVSTIYAWCRAGKIQCVRFGGGGGKSPGHYVELESLRAYLGDAVGVLGL